MEKLAVEGKGNVFATDAILAHLMASPRTIYPWDIVVQKVGCGAVRWCPDNRQEGRKRPWLQLRDVLRGGLVGGGDSATAFPFLFFFPGSQAFGYSCSVFSEPAKIREETSNSRSSCCCH